MGLSAAPFKGTHDPEMGTASTLSDTLFGRTRGAVLAVLGRPCQQEDCRIADALQRQPRKPGLPGNQKPSYQDSWDA